MARRHPTDDDRKEELQLQPEDIGEATPEQTRQAATAGLPPGGAAGFIPEARKTPGGSGEALPNPDPPGPEVKVDRYRVLPNGPSKDGSWPLLVNGSLGHLRPGKIVTSTSYDIDALKEQGIGLEAIA